MSTIGAPKPVESRWREHLRGHLLLFATHPAPAPSRAVGLRLLLLASGLELLRLLFVPKLSTLMPLWLLVPTLLVVALVSIPRVTGASLSQLGLRRWSTWTTTEKSYFLQVLVLAAVLLGLVAALGRAEWNAAFVAVFVTYLFFGFYQELVYRGLVQTELVRRWGAWAGIVAANLLYTFGPLHANYYSLRGELAVTMFVAVFVVGLFFGALYHRSGNLWLPASFHAIGNAAMVSHVGALQ